MPARGHMRKDGKERVRRAAELYLEARLTGGEATIEGLASRFGVAHAAIAAAVRQQRAERAEAQRSEGSP